MRRTGLEPAGRGGEALSVDAGQASLDAEPAVTKWITLTAAGCVTARSLSRLAVSDASAVMLMTPWSPQSGVASLAKAGPLSRSP